MSKEKIFSSEDEFLEYCEQNEDRTILVYEDDVLDVTDFLKDHPGGAGIIEDYNNNEITELFHSAYPHAHSKTALRLLYKYKIGSIKEDGEVPQTVIQTELEEVWGYPRITESKVEYKEFSIDREKGWTNQIASLNKKQYLHVLENPVELSTFRVCENSLLDLLTTSQWYYVPLLCVTVILYLVFGEYLNKTGGGAINKDTNAIETASATLPQMLLGISLGILIWTLTEYILYRFIFYADDHMIDSKWIFQLHFVLYGKHQVVPSDHSKTTIPVIFGALLLWLFYTLSSRILPTNFARQTFFGFVIGYMCYELIHYYIHAGAFNGKYFKGMQKHHTNNHASKGNRGYGVTSKLWDKIFRTEVE